MEYVTRLKIPIMKEKGEKMLNETLDKSMAKAQSREILTKASKFSNVFKNITKDRSFQDEIMHAKLDKYIQQGADTTSAIRESLYDVSNFIAEDPDELQVEIPFNKEPSGEPFFKSLYNKLLACEEEVEVEAVDKEEIERAERDMYVSSLYCA